MKDKIFSFDILLTIFLLLAMLPAFAASSQAPVGTILGVTSTKKPARLVYVDIKTGKVHELLPGDACGPCFSPDGQNIAFVYKNMIYTAPRHDIEARREIAPTPGAYAKHLSWTTDGYIYFGEGKTIFRISAMGKGKKEKVASMPSQIKGKEAAFGYLNVSNDGTRAAWWGKALEGKGNGSFSIEIANPEKTFTYYGRGCRANVSPDGKYILKNDFENFHKEFHIFEFGTDKVIRKFKGSAVNYQKWPNAKDGQNYVFFMSFGAKLLMADVTTGDTWVILDVKKRSGGVNGFDYVNESLDQVLSASTR